MSQKLEFFCIKNLPSRPQQAEGTQGQSPSPAFPLLALALQRFSPVTTETLLCGPGGEPLATCGAEHLSVATAKEQCNAYFILINLRSYMRSVAVVLENHSFFSPFHGTETGRSCWLFVAQP